VGDLPGRHFQGGQPCAVPCRTWSWVHCPAGSGASAGAPRSGPEPGDASAGEATRVDGRGVGVARGSHRVRSRAGAEMVGRRSVETVPESFHIKARVSQNTEFNPSWEVGLVDVDRDCGRRGSRVRGQLPVPTLDTASPADHPRFSLRSCGKMFCPCMPPNWCGTMCLCLGAVRPARSAMGSGVDRTSRGRLPGAESPHAATVLSHCGAPVSLASRREMSMAQDRTRTGSPPAYPLGMPPTTRRSAHLQEPRNLGRWLGVDRRSPDSRSQNSYACSEQEVGAGPRWCATCAQGCRSPPGGCPGPNCMKWPRTSALGMPVTMP
jgi:hypothetical protein